MIWASLLKAVIQLFQRMAIIFDYLVEYRNIINLRQNLLAFNFD
jgi:hypothetical protein